MSDFILVAAPVVAEPRIVIHGTGDAEAAAAMASQGTCRASLSTADSFEERVFQDEQPLGNGEDDEGRIRLVSANPVRRNLLVRYLHRFRNVFKKGIEFNFQSSFWQGSDIRPHRNTVAHSIDAEGRTLTLAIADQM